MLCFTTIIILQDPHDHLVIADLPMMQVTLGLAKTVTTINFGYRELHSPINLPFKVSYHYNRVRYASR